MRRRATALVVLQATALAPVTLPRHGYGTADCVGAGASASINQETGTGIAGTVGAGPSASVNQETGYGTVGTVGAGTSASVLVKSGVGHRWARRLRC